MKRKLTSVPIETVENVVKVLEISESLKEKITDLLQRFGIREELLGHKYMIDAIAVVMENPKLKITKDLYPAIADKHTTAAASVERNIRYAIKVAISGMQDPCEVGKEFFGTEEGVSRKNSLVIRGLADLIRHQ